MIRPGRGYDVAKKPTKPKPKPVAKPPAPKDAPAPPDARSIADRIRVLLESYTVAGKPIPDGKQLADLIAEQLVKQAAKGDLRLLRYIGAAQDQAKPLPSRTELGLLRQAARENWGVPNMMRNEGLLQVYSVLTNPNSSRRSKLAAVRVLEQADRNDLLAERLKLIRIAQAGADTTLTLAELVRDMVHSSDGFDSRTDDDQE